MRPRSPAPLLILALSLLAIAPVAAQPGSGSGSGSGSAPSGPTTAPTVPPSTDSDDSGPGSQQIPSKLVVYTKPIEPFSFKKSDADVGFSIELWERIARELGVTYQIKWVKTVKELIEVVQSKQADVGIAAISITSARERVVDFTTPYYESGLAILTRAQGQGVFALMKETFWTRTMAKAAGVLLLILLACSHLVWLFERRINPEQFPQTYLRGIGEATWWSISTILSGGCDAKGPMHWIGRIFGALWMLTCIVVLTYFTAAITTVMTVSHLTSDINGPGDLPGKVVATVAGSTAETYLKEHGAKVRSFETMDGAFAAMDEKQVTAVVYDQPILAYHVKVAGRPGQQVVGLFERQNYGIALPEGSPLRKRINTILLELAENGVLDDLRTKWFGDEQ